MRGGRDRHRGERRGAQGAAGRDHREGDAPGRRPAGPGGAPERARRRRRGAADVADLERLERPEAEPPGWTSSENRAARSSAVPPPRRRTSRRESRGSPDNPRLSLGHGAPKDPSAPPRFARGRPSAVVGRHGDAWKVRSPRPPSAAARTRPSLSCSQIRSGSAPAGCAPRRRGELARQSRRAHGLTLDEADSASPCPERNVMTVDLEERRPSSCGCASGSLAPPKISPPTTRAGESSTRRPATSTSPTTPATCSTVSSTTPWRRMPSA